MIVALHRVAHARSGDKGDRCNIAVVAWHPALWEVLTSQVTEDAVARFLAHRRPTRVVRHLLPRLHAINLVLDGVLDGGVNAALNLDGHGKTLASSLLALPVEVPDALAGHLVGRP